MHCTYCCLRKEFMLVAHFHACDLAGIIAWFQVSTSAKCRRYKTEKTNSRFVAE